MPLNSRITLTARADQTNSLDLATASAPAALTYELALLNGTGAAQADLIFHDTRTIGASSNDDLDLAGVLANALGGTLTFAKVKAIIVKAASANTNNVVIGNAAATQFLGPFGAAAHTVSLPPGGLFAITAPSAAGWAVGAASSDLLRIANSGGSTSVTYDVMILGASA